MCLFSGAARLILKGQNSKQSTVSLLCLAASLGFLLQNALLFPQGVGFAAVANVLLGGVRGAIVHDPGGFVPISLAVLGNHNCGCAAHAAPD